MSRLLNLGSTPFPSLEGTHTLGSFIIFEGKKNNSGHSGRMAFVCGVHYHIPIDGGVEHMPCGEW